ncbi:30S ribosomal protein S17 [Candidatus Woesearchaeota archaeon]|nr:30S ribosomal protein S17 [Candidatus Woesearchaeota archaeon]
MKKQNTEKKTESEACSDKNCPFHGTLKIRGRTFTGIVGSTKMRKTANIEMERTGYIRKYQRYEKKMTRIKAHNPDCISARQGEKVTAMECRPISKTKKFVIIKKQV